MPCPPKARRRRIVRSVPAGDALRPGGRTLLAARFRAPRAFTLIELMVVVGIIGIIMTISIPSVYRRLHPESMQKAVSDIMEACSHARAYAVLNSQPTDVVITTELPARISVQPVSGARAGSPSGEVPGASEPLDTSAPGGGSFFSATMPESIGVKAIEVNFTDITEAMIDAAHIRFFPNGTCYEFRMVLYQPRTGEYRLLSLEVTTGLMDVESDPRKFLQ